MQQNPWETKAGEDGVTCQHREMVQQLCDLSVTPHTPTSPASHGQALAAHPPSQALPKVSAFP